MCYHKNSALMCHIQLSVVQALWEYQIQHQEHAFFKHAVELQNRLVFAYIQTQASFMIPNI